MRPKKPVGYLKKAKVRCVIRIAGGLQNKMGEYARLVYYRGQLHLRNADGLGEFDRPVNNFGNYELYFNDRDAYDLLPDKKCWVYQVEDELYRVDAI